MYSVSELNRAARDLLEHSFGLLWVEGEMSNLARPRSGHVYFSLKDGQAQVRCALFRNRARLLRVALDNGVQIRVRARVSLYTARGDFQLIVEHAEAAGAGALQRAFEALRARLDAEGLFAAEGKRTLPARPARVGVITSATGAAIRDVLSVASRRYPLGALRIYPVPVQGEAAAPAIVAALNRAGMRRDCDVLLLVRGGGSLEDLWAFNDEAVARAIVACPIPVVSGVGHEVDVTIADLAADVRAATPSAAAERVCPDLSAEVAALPRAVATLEQRMRFRIAHRRERVAALEQRLSRQHPARRIQTAAQRLDDAELRLHRLAVQRTAAARERLDRLTDRLWRIHPRRRLGDAGAHVGALAQQLRRAGMARLTAADQRLTNARRALHAVSPLHTLERGYAIARTPDGAILRDAQQVAAGQRIAVDLAHGRLACDVVERQPRATLDETLTYSHTRTAPDDDAPSNG